MLQQAEVKSFILESLEEVLRELSAETAPPLHADLFDDQPGASPGRIASFELSKRGDLDWWNWKSDDACGRADWPLKLRLEFSDDTRYTVWLRGSPGGKGQSWDIQDHRRATRPARV